MVLAEREACAKVCKDLADHHKKATGECDQGCDYVAAWETAEREILERYNDQIHGRR